MENEELIPTQRIGQQSDAEDQKTFSSQNDAKIAYRISTGHLLKVNNWGKISNITGVRFQLIGGAGEELDRLAEEKDFIRIDIEAKDTQPMECQAWVYIEHFEEFIDIYRDIECMILVTRPSNIPGSDDRQTAHFLSRLATSTFIVFRTANVLNVEIHGRNETPNSESFSLVELANNSVANNISEADLWFKHWLGLVKAILG